MPHLLRAVTAAGGDATALARKLGLSAEARFEDRIPIATVIDAWEAAIAVTGRRDLPLLAGTRAEHDERSMIGFVVANQPRLGDGVARFDRYYPTVSNAYRWSQVIDNTALRLVASPPGPVHRLGWQAYLEFEATDMIVIASRLTGGGARPTEVRFLHPSPPATCVDQLAKVLGVVPEFSSTACEVVFPVAMLDLAVPTARPSLAKLVEDRLDVMLDAIERGNDMAARVRTVLATLMRDGVCDVSGLAKALHLSRRSLERALAEEGTSARALIEAERKQLALTWLPELSVDEVATRLGYSDARAFARAFKRWTGKAPGAIRKATGGRR
jgi:AraC-like DNA-binding protein